MYIAYLRNSEKGRRGGEKKKREKREEIGPAVTLVRLKLFVANTGEWRMLACHGAKVGEEGKERGGKKEGEKKRHRRGDLSSSHLLSSLLQEKW